MNRQQQPPVSEHVDANTMLQTASLLDPTGDRGPYHHRRLMVVLSGAESSRALQRAFAQAHPEDEIILAHVSPHRPLHYQTWDTEQLHAEMRARKADLILSGSVMKEALEQCHRHSRYCHPLALVNPTEEHYTVASTLAQNAQRLGVDRIVAGDDLNPIMELDLQASQPAVYSLRPPPTTQEARDFKHRAEDSEARAAELLRTDQGSRSN